LTTTASASPSPTSCKATKARSTRCWTRRTRRTGSDPADKNSETYDEAYLESLHHDTDNIHFSADGLVITYPATAVISFGLAGGENTRVLPYAQLRGIIKDAYLPQ
jgi:hypothetical protein